MLEVEMLYDRSMAPRHWHLLIMQRGVILGHYYNRIINSYQSMRKFGLLSVEHQ